MLSSSLLGGFIPFVFYLLSCTRSAIHNYRSCASIIPLSTRVINKWPSLHVPYQRSLGNSEGHRKDPWAPVGDSADSPEYVDSQGRTGSLSIQWRVPAGWGLWPDRCGPAVSSSHMFPFPNSPTPSFFSKPQNLRFSQTTTILHQSVSQSVTQQNAVVVSPSPGPRRPRGPRIVSCLLSLQLPAANPTTAPPRCSTTHHRTSSIRVP